MKKLLILLTIVLLTCGVAFAASVPNTRICDNDGDCLSITGGGTATPASSNRFQATITSGDAVTLPRTVQSGTTGENIYILSLTTSVGTNQMEVQYQDGAATVLIEDLHLGASSDVTITFPETSPLVVASGQSLDVVSNASGDVTVIVTGYVE